LPAYLERRDDEGGNGLGQGGGGRGTHAPAARGRKALLFLIQLLEDDKGEKLVRFAYSTDGKARRGPVTLRAADLERLRQELAGSPGLAEVLPMEAKPETL
jgi:hypothetical protein